MSIKSTQVTRNYINHGDHIVVCKLVAEESGKSDVLNGMLSGGLCGIVGASDCGSGDFVTTPSVGRLVDGSPRRGLSKAFRGGVKRFPTASSEGNKEDDELEDAVMPSTSPERRREV